MKSPLCKSLFLAMAIMAIHLALVSCSAGGTQESPLTRKKLGEALSQATTDPAVKEFTPAMVDTLEMYLDSALVAVRSQDASTEKLLTERSICLMLAGALMEKGTNCPPEQLDRIIGKMDKIQFEFECAEGDDVCLLSLMNVFLPSHHEEAALADYFDLYAFFNKHTAQCDSMECVLPTFIDDESAVPAVSIFVTDKGMSTEGFRELETSQPRYSPQYGTWSVTIPGTEFPLILQSANMYLYVTDSDEGGMEASTIRLSLFKEQYARIKEQSRKQ